MPRIARAACLSRKLPTVSVPVSSSGAALSASSHALANAASAIDAEPAYMLEFYATECALKAAVVRHFHVRGWTNLAPDIRQDHQHHDLRRLAKNISAGGTAVRDLIDCRRRGTSEMVAIKDVHAAWRYGTKLDTQDERRLRRGLTAVRNWLKERE